MTNKEIIAELEDDLRIANELLDYYRPMEKKLREARELGLYWQAEAERLAELESDA